MIYVSDFLRMDVLDSRMWFPLERCQCFLCEIVNVFTGGMMVIDLELDFQDERTEEIPVKQPQQMVTSSWIMGVMLKIPDSLKQFPESLRTCRKRCFLELQQMSKARSKRISREANDNTVVHHRSAPKASPRRSRSFRARGSNSSTRKRVNLNEESSNILTISITCKDEFQSTCKFILEDMLSMPCLKSLQRLGDEVRNLSISDLPELLLMEEHLVPAKKRRAEAHCATKWDSLPLDVQDSILLRADFKDLIRCKAVSKACKERIESDAFCQLRGAATSEGSFTAISYYIRNSAWRCSGYDMESNSWRPLPTFSYLPSPDKDLFKEFSVSGHRSLMCAHVSKLPNKGELVVFNPFTGRKIALPPLLYPRYPVLVHILVDSGGKSYTVVVAGSSSACDEHLSKKVEVFRSTTSKWVEAGDVPGPVFGLNDHQAGVCINGVLYCIAFLDGSRDRGVVAFDVENGTWVENLTCPIPFALHSNTLQLVECNGKLHLFSEQERGASVEHCIDALESAREGTWHWRNVVRVKRPGGRGLQVYPEHTCVSFGEGKLCMLSTLSRDGAVYDMRDGKQVADLPPPPANQKGERFFTMNPASFTLQPRFDTNPVSPFQTIAANS